MRKCKKKLSKDIEHTYYEKPSVKEEQQQKEEQSLDKLKIKSRIHKTITNYEKNGAFIKCQLTNIEPVLEMPHHIDFWNYPFVTGSASLIMKIEFPKLQDITIHELSSNNQLYFYFTRYNCIK